MEKEEEKEGNYIHIKQNRLRIIGAGFYKTQLLSYGSQSAVRFI